MSAATMSCSSESDDGEVPSLRQELGQLRLHSEKQFQQLLKMMESQQEITAITANLAARVAQLDRRAGPVEDRQRAPAVTEGRLLEMSLKLEAAQEAAKALAQGHATAETRAMVAEAKLSTLEAALAAAVAEAQQAKEKILQTEAESASLRATLQGVREIFMCPVRQSLCRNAVVASDGHTYDKRSLEEWMQRQGTSPMTRERLLPHLFPNRVAIAVLQQLTAAGLGPSEEEAAETPRPPFGYRRPPPEAPPGAPFDVEEGEEEEGVVDFDLFG